MNINNATQSNVSQINNETRTQPEASISQASASSTKAANEDKVSISQSGKVNSHLQSLPPKHQAEINSFVNNLNKQAANPAFVDAQIKQAPETVKKMAEKLNMGIKEIAAALPAETVSKPIQTSSKGVAAYNSVAAQSQPINNSALLNNTATKPMTAKSAIA